MNKVLFCLGKSTRREGSSLSFKSAEKAQIVNARALNVDYLEKAEKTS